MGVLSVKKNFEKTPFRKIMDKLFTLGNKYKDGVIDLMEGLVELFMNSSYGIQILKDINES